MSRERRLGQLTVAALLAACMAASSWIVAPAPSSVPLTLQTFFVALAALLLRPRWAAASMLVYVGLGALGLPVFSGGRGGAAILAGPTGGYLLAFIVAAATGSLIVGAGRERVRQRPGPARRLPSLWRQALAAGAMIAVINILGTAWLATSARLSLGAAVVAGVLPFIAGDALKAAVAIATARLLARARSLTSVRT